MLQQYFVGAILLTVLLAVISMVNTYFSYPSVRIHGFWTYITPMAINVAPAILIAVGLFLSRSKRTFDLATVFTVLLVTCTVLLLTTVLMVVTMLTSDMISGDTSGYLPYGPLLIVVAATSAIIYKLKQSKQW